MRTITADEVRKIFRQSNAEKSFLSLLFARLGIEDELGRGVDVPCDHFPKLIEGMTRIEFDAAIKEWEQAYGHLANSTMLSPEEWKADRLARHAKMREHAAALDGGALYDHPSHTCEHGDWMPAINVGFNCGKCHAFRLKLPENRSKP